MPTNTRSPSFRSCTVRKPSAVSLRSPRWGYWASVLILLVGCRIEQVVPVEGDASDAPLSTQPSPPRYSTDEAPLTPFRSLLQGAWSPDEEPEPKDIEPIRKSPLAGVQVMVAAPVVEVGRTALLQLCKRLVSAPASQTDPLGAVSATLQHLECWLPIELAAQREGLLASASGLWGAAVAVPPDRSAVAVAERSLRAGLGFVVWSALPPRLHPETPLFDSTVRADAELACPGAPPISLAASAADAMPQHLGEAVYDLGSGRRAAEADGGTYGERGFRSEIDAGMALDRDAGIDLARGPKYPVPQVVFVGVRTAMGDLVAGAFGVSPRGERAGSVGEVALPSRRLMVGDAGIVLVDPALSRHVTPDPLAALRDYEHLSRGEDVGHDTLALLPEGPIGAESPFVHYLHVPQKPWAGCEPGDVR